MRARGGGVKLENILLGLAKGGIEQRAVDAGEIDAVIDYANSNVVLLPAARRALREAGAWDSAASEAPEHRSSIVNSLLGALPKAEYQELLGGLELLALPLGEVLQQPGVPLAHVYFPVDCVIVLLATAEHERGLGVGLIGYEGMLGISLALGSDAPPVRALVQAGGAVLRMNAEPFHAALRRCPALQRALYRYAHAKLAQAWQTAACNSLHATEARLARWLLMISERARSEELLLTQALLADLLGVQRTTINEAAGPLQQRGLIGFSRGKIRILDRKRLEAACCGCYRVMSGT